METIKGYVEHIIYQNTENGYTVLNLISEGEDITCVGILKNLGPGENICAEGVYVSHPIYGEQFKIQSFQVTAPEDKESMERYLGSGAVKGIGAALAARIVKKFGDDTFRIIEEEPERLAEIKGISERKAREISMQMEEKKELREAMVYLTKFGISNTLAVKIYETYGVGLYSVMQENPYRLAEDIHGVGFKRQMKLHLELEFTQIRIIAFEVDCSIPYYNLSKKDIRGFRKKCCWNVLWNFYKCR